MSNNLENIKNWILNSGLIISDNQNPNFGGVYSFFDESKKKYGFIYPEITGYSISACSFLYQIDKNETVLKLARASSDWLTKLFDEYDGIIQGIENSNSLREKLAYSFDTAICAKGLLDCYKVSNDSKFIEYSKKLTDWLLRSIENDGTLMPFMDLETKKFGQSDDVWYKKKGCFHIKTAIPLLQLYEITQNATYLKKAKLVCDAFQNFQQDDGSFSIHENTKTINLHTQSYALEGLLTGYFYLKKYVYLESCERALDWCVSNIEDDGSIPLWFNSNEKSKSMYPIAQIIRLMILVNKIQSNDKYLQSIEKLLKFMFSFQAVSSDKRIHGGFYEEFYKSRLGWKKRIKLNSWGSLFALQAMYWYEHYNEIDFKKLIVELY